MKVSAALALTVATLLAIALQQPTHAGDNAVHSISYVSINDSRRDTPLRDNDIINVGEFVNATTPDKLIIRLELKGNVTWWKGILLFERNQFNQYKRVVEGQGRGQSFEAIIPVSDLGKYDLVLSKAKQLGVHTNMYHIKDAATCMKGGNKYVFSWWQD